MYLWIWLINMFMPSSGLCHNLSVFLFLDIELSPFKKSLQPFWNGQSCSCYHVKLNWLLNLYAQWKMTCRTAPLSHPHSKHREKVLLKVLKYKTFPFIPWFLCLCVSQIVMMFFIWHPSVVLSKIKNLNDYHEFYLLVLYCPMPILNANVNIFNSYEKSLKWYNLHFIAPTDRHILSYQKSRNTSQN